jgi:hypothetical protein
MPPQHQAAGASICRPGSRVCGRPRCTGAHRAGHATPTGGNRTVAARPTTAAGSSPACWQLATGSPPGGHGPAARHPGRGPAGKSQVGHPRLPTARPEAGADRPPSALTAPPGPASTRTSSRADSGALTAPPGPATHPTSRHQGRPADQQRNAQAGRHAARGREPVTRHQAASQQHDPRPGAEPATVMPGATPGREPTGRRRAGAGPPPHQSPARRRPEPDIDRGRRSRSGSSPDRPPDPAARQQPTAGAVHRSPRRRAAAGLTVSSCLGAQPMCG